MAHLAQHWGSADRIIPRSACGCRKPCHPINSAIPPHYSHPGKTGIPEHAGALLSACPGLQCRQDFQMVPVWIADPQLLAPACVFIMKYLHKI